MWGEGTGRRRRRERRGNKKNRLGPWRWPAPLLPRREETGLAPHVDRMNVALELGHFGRWSPGRRERLKPMIHRRGAESAEETERRPKSQ